MEKHSGFSHKNDSFSKNLIQAANLSIPLLILVFSIRIFEIFYFQKTLFIKDAFLILELKGFIYDLLFWSSYSFLIFLVIYPLQILFKKALPIGFHLATAIYFFSSLGLIFFFAQRGAALDHELFNHNLSNVQTTLKASGIFTFHLVWIFALLSAFYLLIVKFVYLFRFTIRESVAIFIFWILGFVFSLVFQPQLKGHQLSINKAGYFATNSILNLKSLKNKQNSDFSAFGKINKKSKSQIKEYQKLQQKKFISTTYPLLHKNENENPLKSYIQLKETKPNIVVVIVESLSRDFCGKKAPLGNFVTPFIDSLTQNSLYWENCLSSSAISFEVLPTLLGSLPYGNQGFNMLPQYPGHQSLVPFLKVNGYSTAFITGAPMYFDNQGAFMRYQGTDQLTYNFPEKYQTVKTDGSWNWGYPDQAILTYGLELADSMQKSPFFQVYVTISTHPPYDYREKEIYQQKFTDLLEKQPIDDSQKEELLKISDLMASFIYLDDELRNFFTVFQKRDDFENTIFIITGDHHAYFPPENELGKFHVPLIIYSPLITKNQTFSSVVTHHDVVPTLVNLLKGHYSLPQFEWVHWMGNTLDTSSVFQCHQSIPLIDWNKDIHYFLDSSYFLTKNQLYKITDANLNIIPVDDEKIKNRIEKKLDLFKKLNSYCSYNNKIIPDSLIFYRAANPNSTTIFKQTITDEIETSSEFPQTISFLLPQLDHIITIKASFDIKLPKQPLDSLPKLVISIQDEKSQEKFFYDSKDLRYLNNNEINNGQWVSMELNDIVDVTGLKLNEHSRLYTYLYNPKKYQLTVRNFSLEVSYIQKD